MSVWKVFLLVCASDFCFCVTFVNLAYLCLSFNFFDCLCYCAYNILFVCLFVCLCFRTKGNIHKWRPAGCKEGEGGWAYCDATAYWLGHKGLTEEEGGKNVLIYVTLFMNGILHVFCLSLCLFGSYFVLLSVFQMSSCLFVCYFAWVIVFLSVFMFVCMSMFFGKSYQCFCLSFCLFLCYFARLISAWSVFFMSMLFCRDQQEIEMEW